MRNERLTTDELDELHTTVNERRKGSTHIKINAVALHHLLADYGALMHELEQQKYFDRGLAKLIP